MQGANWYEDLIHQNLEVAVCKKNELKEKLQEFSGNLNLKEDVLIIQSCKTKYKIYHTQKDMEGENVSIQLSPALRFRLELDIFDFEQEMLKIDQAVLQYPFDVLTEPFCQVQYMNLSDDFLILDVYVGMKEREKS